MGQWAELSQWKPLFFWPVRMSQMIMAWGSSLVSIRGLKVTTYLQVTTQPVSDTRPSNCCTNIWSYMDYSTCCNTYRGPNLTRAEWYGEEKKKTDCDYYFYPIFRWQLSKLFKIMWHLSGSVTNKCLLTSGEEKKNRHESPLQYYIYKGVVHLPNLAVALFDNIPINCLAPINNGAQKKLWNTKNNSLLN